MLLRKVLTIRGELEDLREYAASLHATLGLEYDRAAKRCLDVLEKLKPDSLATEFFHSQKSKYPPLENPRQLGIVQLYWFFHSECGCTGGESEVRVAMIANEFLTPVGGRKLRYTPTYKDAESQGSSAVRLAVSRFRPRTVG
jgi:hypothetical protein